MYSPREEQRDFLFTLSSLAIWMIPAFALIAFLAQSGATVAMIKVWPATMEAVVTAIKIPPYDDNVRQYEYSFSKADGTRFVDVFELQRQPGAPTYVVGQTIEIMQSRLFPDVQLPRERYEHSRMNFLVFTFCIAAIFLLLAVSIYALVRQCTHAREDIHY